MHNGKGNKTIIPPMQAKGYVAAAEYLKHFLPSFFISTLYTTATVQIIGALLM